MSVISGAIVWTITCDRRHCANSLDVTAATCTQALLDAEQRGWQTRYDGTTYCPDHVMKGHRK